MKLILKHFVKFPFQNGMNLEITRYENYSYITISYSLFGVTVSNSFRRDIFPDFFSGFYDRLNFKYLQH